MDRFKYLFLRVALACGILHTVASGSVSWSGWSGSSSQSENYDGGKTLDGFSASCTLNWEDCWFNFLGIRLGCSDESETKACSCSISSNPASGLFYMSGSTSQWYINKNSCSQTTCGNYPSGSTCSTSNGCASARTYSIGVRCSGSNSHDSVSSTQTHTTTFTAESPFSITNLDATASASRTQGSSTVIFSTTTTAGLTVYQWVESSPVANSWLLSTSRLFRLNTGNGQVYINSNPSDEYSWTYSMRICAYSRRQTDCGTLTIQFSGCYQQPTCENDSKTVADTHPVGGTLFTMVVPNPTDHFITTSFISSSFTGLSYEIVYTTLNVASIDPTTGVLTSTGNVTVFPSYPNKVYTMIVRVSNAESCSYTSTCTMTLTATFTNWPIDIRSLDRSFTIHEDTDARTRLHTIITYDYNYEWEDNVTCVQTYNSDPTLLELVHDGNHNFSYEMGCDCVQHSLTQIANSCTTFVPHHHTAYSIYKKRCRDPGCGWLCNLNIGCLSHNITQQYTFSVRCSDAYGSFDDGTLTINIQQNAAPVWTNLPKTIIVNTDATSDLDIIYTFYYSDYENENLDYNYTISPAQPSPALFSFDSFGNYYNNPANVTSLQYQWPLGNATYTLYVCGTERRNTICDTLTIQLRDFCGPTPTCDNAVNQVTDQFSVGGNLFSINAPAPATGSYTALSYAIFSSVDLFTVDASTGIVTSTGALPITNPPTTTSYSITANVYDTAACGYAVCHLSLNVTFTNFDIRITNMDSVTTNLHEDIHTENTLHTITTSDANSEDRATCVLDEVNSVPANNGKFIVRETYADSGVYIVLNKEAPGFDYGTTTSYTVAVTCSDLYGSSASATMTVNIDENAQPVLTNLPGSINVDPITATNGAEIFTLSYTDAENDAMTYFCNVTDSEQPLQCLTDGVVSMRRNVSVPTEEGKTYAITMCITDPLHAHTHCGVLSVTITSSKTNPEISNLPSTVTFDEFTSSGTVLFTLAVSDPDAQDIHTYTLDNILPLHAVSLFTFVQTSGVLTLASSLDYETDVSYNFTFSVRDTYLPGLAYKTLYLQVTDVNEAPRLTLYTTLLNTREGNTGQVIGTVIFACSDVDSGQTPTVTITGGTYMSYFSLDPTTGELTFAQNWDYESASLPESTVLVLTCSDGVGLTDSGTMTVSITPVNEFAPVPSITEIEMTIYSTQRIQDTLFSITATDEDYSDDGLFVYEIAGMGEGAQYFTMSSTGHLTLTDYISWTYNYTFSFTVVVSDNETYPLKGSVNVTIHYIAPEPAPLPGRPTKCTTCTTTGRIVVASLSICGLIVVALFVHAVVRTRLWTVCQSEPVRMNQDAVKTKARQTHRQQRRQELRDMFKEEEEEGSDSDSDDAVIKNRRYTVDKATMNKAIPRVKPPGAYNYPNLPNLVTDLPEPATYNPAISASILPEPRVMPNSYNPPPTAPKQNYAFTKLDAFQNPVKRITKPGVPATRLAPAPAPGKLYNATAHPTGSGPPLSNNPLFGKRQTGAVPVAYQTQTGPSSNTRRKLAFSSTDTPNINTLF